MDDVNKSMLKCVENTVTEIVMPSPWHISFSFLAVSRVFSLNVSCCVLTDADFLCRKRCQSALSVQNTALVRIQ